MAPASPALPPFLRTLLGRKPVLWVGAGLGGPERHDDRATREWSMLGPQGASVAADLHRAGVPQVLGYFGPVPDPLAVEVDRTLFEELARTGSTLKAVRAARLRTVGFRGVCLSLCLRLPSYHTQPRVAFQRVIVGQSGKLGERALLHLAPGQEAQPERLGGLGQVGEHRQRQPQLVGQPAAARREVCAWPGAEAAEQALGQRRRQHPQVRKRHRRRAFAPAPGPAT